MVDPSGMVLLVYFSRTLPRTGVELARTMLLGEMLTSHCKAIFPSESKMRQAIFSALMGERRWITKAKVSEELNWVLGLTMETSCPDPASLVPSSTETATGVGLVTAAW